MENDLIKRIELKEVHAKRRAVLFTLIPIIAAIILVTFTSNKVVQSEERVKTANAELNTANEELHIIKDQNYLLLSQNDSLAKNLTESVVTLGKAVSVTTEFKKFIDKMKPELRSQSEASYYINFKMMEDKIRGDYEYLSERVSTLPKLDENNIWIVIVQSSLSLEDLRKEASPLISIYGKEQVVIFRDLKGNYALSVKGNGTFTRAYRLNVELRDKYHYYGSYFSNSLDWGIDYLKIDHQVLDPGH